MNAWWSSSAYGLATRKPAHTRPAQITRLRQRACATGETSAAATIAGTMIPAVYLVAIATPSAPPASRYSRIRPVR